MRTRREFTKLGLTALALGLMRRTGRALPIGVLRGRAVASPTPPWLDLSRPFAPVAMHPVSTIVDGLPFAAGFLGDPFDSNAVPFHHAENVFPGGAPPAPDEEVDVAIVGGGLSGLATAYFLRHRRPVLFELRQRFGGVSQGETWGNESYSFGGAYFIAPDEGSFLEGFYRELGLDDVHRESAGGHDPMEVNGVIREDFWSGAGQSPEVRKAFEAYAKIVRYFADDSYPDIPLVDGRDNAWILELDGKTLRQDLEARMGMPMPAPLAAGIQSYCYSSFDAGWEQISAASGWNFIAAEEFGRWVCPGGNVYVTDELWRRLVQEYTAGPGHQVERLRPGTRAVDVRADTGAPGGRIQVTYKKPDGSFRSLLARRVVMACSKHVAKYVLHDLVTHDSKLLDAMHQVQTVSYLVANVLLTAPIVSDDYDVFLLGSSSYPMDIDTPPANHRVADVLRGDFAQPSPASRSVLTLYWPMPSQHAPFEILAPDAWNVFAPMVAAEVRKVLALRGLSPSDVRQVRIARWGHAMPIARPRFIADGTAARLRAPYLDHVWFVNQDNWALPAFETAVLEAKHFADVIDASL